MGVAFIVITCTDFCRIIDFGRYLCLVLFIDAADASVNHNKNAFMICLLIMGLHLFWVQWVELAYM